MADSLRPHPWDSPGKNTGVGCHFLLQCMKVKSESEVAQLCPTLRDPVDCSPPGSSVHGIFQARVLEWVPLPSPRTRLAENKWFRNPSITWQCGKLLVENNYQKLNYSLPWGLCTCFTNLIMIFVHIYQIETLTDDNWGQVLTKSELSREGRRFLSHEGQVRADLVRHLFWHFHSFRVSPLY